MFRRVPRARCRSNFVQDWQNRRERARSCRASSFCRDWTKLGRPRKTLLGVSNSFRPGRYGFLLAIEQLPVKAPFSDRRRRLIWKRLLELQEHYRAAEADENHDADWRRSIVAESFSSYVCGLHGRLPSWLPLEPRPVRPPAQPALASPSEYVFSVQLRCQECGREAEAEAPAGSRGWARTRTRMRFRSRSSSAQPARRPSSSCRRRPVTAREGAERTS